MFVDRLERLVGRILRPQKEVVRRSCSNDHNRFVSPESPLTCMTAHFGSCVL